MHPGDDPDACVGRVGGGQHPGDLVGRRHHALGHDPDRDVGGFLEALGDPARVLLDRSQDLRSVEVLAARDEPGLQLAQRLVAHPFTAPDMKPRM